MERRNWVPNVETIADQLIEDYRNATFSSQGIGTKETVPEGNLAAAATMASWFDTTRFHGDEWQQDDWLALVQELAKRAAWPQGLP